MKAMTAARLTLGIVTSVVATITMVSGEHILWLVAAPLWAVWAGWEHRVFLARHRS